MTTNNFFTIINIHIFVIGVVSGVITTVSMKFFYKFIDEYFLERKSKRDRKRELAKSIIEVCTEGSLVAYNAMPEDQSRVQHTATLTEGLDEILASNIRSYLGLWVICALRQTPGPYENRNPSSQDIEFITNIQSQAKDLEDLILKQARVWE